MFGLNNVLYISYVMDILFYERFVMLGVYNFVCWLGGVIVLILLGIIGYIVLL